MDHAPADPDWFKDIPSWVKTRPINKPKRMRDIKMVTEIELLGRETPYICERCHGAGHRCIILKPTLSHSTKCSRCYNLHRPCSLDRNPTKAAVIQWFAAEEAPLVAVNNSFEQAQQATMHNEQPHENQGLASLDMAAALEHAVQQGLQSVLSQEPMQALEGTNEESMAGLPTTYLDPRLIDPRLLEPTN